jgi:hypothetical protein
VKTDLDVLAELATRLGLGARFQFHNSEAVFDELRAATRGAERIIAA